MFGYVIEGTGGVQIRTSKGCVVVASEYIRMYTDDVIATPTSKRVCLVNVAIFIYNETYLYIHNMYISTYICFFLFMCIGVEQSGN